MLFICEAGMAASCCCRVWCCSCFYDGCRVSLFMHATVYNCLQLQ
jgi:hypothetical protein